MGLQAQDTTLGLFSAGPGSGFLPYAQGLMAFMAARGGPKIELRESTGSLVNLRAVEASPTAIGTVFLGSAHDAVTGAGPFNGTRLTNIRALFPMYETSFQIAALKARGFTSIRNLNGLRVGVGPAGGPAEVFFRAAAEVAKVTPVVVNGSPADQTRQLLAGEIDAFWQGAIVPIPALKAAADAAEVTIIGIDEADIPALLQRFPTLSAATVPGGSYRGQTAPVRSVAAWNFVVAHKDMPDAVAAQLTRLALSAANPATDIHPSAAGTRRENAVTNGVLPFHPGALAVYREWGVAVR
jgi:TRAP transporter TAXI family solute receptor